MILFASDLDNTLIHSYKRADKADICVETKDGKCLSYMTPMAYSMLQELDNVCFVPITTRSLEQYQRIQLFEGRYPQYAMTSNGGLLLVDNEIDKQWRNDSLELIGECMTELENAVKYLDSDADRSFEVRYVDDLFVFTKSAVQERTKERLYGLLDTDKVSIFNNGEKVYVLPKILTKGAAIKRLAAKMGFKKIICAGDSDFDITMLEIADVAIYPDKSLMKKQSVNHCIPSLKGNFAEYVLKTVSEVSCVEQHKSCCMK